ncbi:MULTISPECIES: hypothetical protein [Flavobacterium]|uniref:hypothetical protein n=1 Tax=Flavobacterium TaxID=237 RepID=UPI00391BE933
MELLFQLALNLLYVCVIVFIVSLVSLIASKGKSKLALRLVLISAITVVTLLVIGFGTCIYLATH